MRRGNGFSLFAICATFCLAIVGVVHLHLFDASDDAVARSMRYDVSWIGANGRIEAAHLEKHVARFAALGEPADADAARLYYEILLGRMKVWDAGGYRQFIDLSPTRRDQFDAVRERTAALASDMARLDDPAAQRAILGALAEIAPLIDQIGAEAHTISVTEAAAIRNELQEKQQAQSMLVLLLLLCGAISLVLMVLQNRSLHAAHLKAEHHAKELSFLAQHDALTKLPNRLAFDAALRAVSTAEPNERIAVAAIDLDGFKSVNDILGHAAGDALLTGAAELFVNEVSRTDPRNIVCRVGGDEFLALFRITGGQAEALGLAQEILDLLREPIETTYGSLMVGASIGVAISGEDSGDEDLILDADLALREAKAQGKGIVLGFEPRMRVDLQRRLRIEADLDRAIANGDIYPHYQLQFDLGSGRPIGAEALARWCHPELGWISPAEFIPIAESSGAVVRMGRAILETACRDATDFPEDFSLSVNLSVVQLLKDDIVGTVKGVLARTGLEPERLTLEVTESTMMTDLGKMLDVLARLKKCGVSISLDDFGTGYSALSYLTKFEWDELKIDRSFVASLLSNPMNLAIIRTVRALARKMGAKVTVEGIETVEQRRLLTRLGCDAGQGYLFGRPVPAQEIRSVLAGGGRRDEESPVARRFRSQTTSS
jgi:diguanylate cyclase (GGDEF)-like protein